MGRYPARLIEASPIPEGFLPKPSPSKAQAWLYPAEEKRLLACRDVPLLYRLFYGFLAREGMRRDEALSLTWANVDLERGTVMLDENKTDDPRAWTLGEDVTRALKIWREQFCRESNASTKIYFHEISRWMESTSPPRCVPTSRRPGASVPNCLNEPQGARLCARTTCEQRCHAGAGSWQDRNLGLRSNGASLVADAQLVSPSRANCS